MENILRDLLSTEEPSEIEPSPPVDKFMELRRIIIEQRAKIEKLESDLKQFCSDKKSLVSGPRFPGPDPNWPEMDTYGPDDPGPGCHTEKGNL